MKFTSGFLAVAFMIASGALAAPWPSSSKHATHRLRSLPNGKRVLAFHREPTFETFAEGIEHVAEKRAPGDWKALGLSFLESRLGAGSLHQTSSFTNDVASHVFVQQSVKGIPVVNAVANVALNKGEKVVSFGHTFVTPKTISSTTPKLTAAEAIARAEEQLSGTHDGTPTKIEFVFTENDHLALVHTVQVESNDNGHLLESFIDAATGEVVQVHDFTNSITYRVLPIRKQAPTEGFEVLTDPADLTASPNGWQQVPGSTATTTTSGNNAIAFKTSQTTGLSSENVSNGFQFVWNSTAQPTVSPNIDVARVNAFYIVNTIHDITYRYGFTESAFNFQQNNNGKGGAANDRVTISVQDSAGTDNADFTTPADGQSGRMRMFLWDFTNPRRDGAIENDIVAHENTHGLSNRLTGGGTGRCLQTTEAGGMGEGWSDAFADWTEQAGPTIRDFTMGAFVISDSAGIRSHPYSTSTTTNPLNYGSIKTLNEVHDIGEAWANILHNVHAALITAHGFSTDAFTNPNGTGGNVVFLHLLIDALALQPCNPTFLTARDAWIQADVNRFAGANKCTLWKAFASRGLGVNAANHTNNAAVPAGC
ncbi:putative extracellular elastinolytic metallo proteinase precursor [Exidia glandulosa HHB12029]|uniref:Extracellular metalloproteinase n=1 Tax=Exidia glandulosa HHB12029 TaxID=1314781 RepID=A0A165ZRH5_EXIGL|nr:putative extracellular elastinolytic metallo proteinase precursor [Exidia glandulosa HHB12029]